MTDNDSPARIELDRALATERFRIDTETHAERFRMDRQAMLDHLRWRALDLGMVYHRDVAKVDKWPRDESEHQPVTPEEIVATADVFLAWLTRP